MGVRPPRLILEAARTAPRTFGKRRPSLLTRLAVLAAFTFGSGAVAWAAFKSEKPGLYPADGLAVVVFFAAGADSLLASAVITAWWRATAPPA